MKIQILVGLAALSLVACKHPTPPKIEFIQAGGFSDHDFNACLPATSIPASVCAKDMSVQLTEDEKGCVVDMECKTAAGKIKIIKAAQTTTALTFQGSGGCSGSACPPEMVQIPLSQVGQ